MIKRYVVTESEFIRIKSELVKQETYFSAGHASLYAPSIATKYLNEKAVRHWLDLDGNIIPMSAGEAARTELSRAFPDIKRVGWLPREISLFDARSPCHFTGPATGEMIYIDLVSAYYQIYKCLWLDTTYPRGLYGQFPLYDVAERLKHWKAARNGVLGIIRSRHLVGFRGHKRVEMSVRNKFLSPGLWATVQHTLHWIAIEAINKGAIYVNTDGYLFPQDTSNVDVFLDYLVDHHLDYKVRAVGAGDVVAWNAYKVGAFSTLPYKLKLANLKQAKEFSNVITTGREGWAKYRQRVHRLVRYSQREGGFGSKS